ncbi:unnamed protein product [Oppiella nova]|uniref:UDP-glycosyltransferase n=1 Tax=Oppiella nova TaxID=334625 RepID=A0A7R9LWK8_9ACAR|nr:unnamed protein product [Oppiella nova]CAG2167584.1 unnamed protein product [Oppiella nova]
MWGERSVPSHKVLPIIDLIITSGHNNNVSETMYFGKPMIVMPVWLDQLDAAQRVAEKGLGVRLNPYECSENELLDSIDSVLNDKILAQKLAKGQVHGSVGMAEILRDTGRYNCVFAVNGVWKALLESKGFDVKLMESVDFNDAIKDSLDSSLMDPKNTKTFAKSLEPTSRINTLFLKYFIREAKETDPYVKTIIEDLKPDLIISDHFINYPSIVKSGIPWIFSWNDSALSLDLGYPDKRLPPSYLGLPTNTEREMKEKYRQQLWERNIDLWYKYRDELMAIGCPPLYEFQYWSPSPYANFYLAPKELDYTDIRPLPDTFHGFDCFKRSGSEDTLEIPDNLKNRSGKLIFLSFDMFVSRDVELMKRLVAILSKSKHRFIVSKGLKHNEYELADNMWGEISVSPHKVLPIIDLIITSGHNNHVSETMYFGKPMIVMPVWFDQLDTAQRVVEKGLGVRLNPYECSENELLDSIDSVLNDKILAQKLAKVSQRVQSEGNSEKLVKIVNKLIK